MRLSQKTNLTEDGFLNVLDHPDVKGDRINDDWSGINETILQAEQENKSVYFPHVTGYYITDTLPYPLSSKWFGEIPWKTTKVNLPVESYEHINDDEYLVTLGSTTFNLNYFVREDTIRFANVSSTIDGQGSHGIVSYDNNAKTITVRYPGGSPGSSIDVPNAPADAIASVEYIASGSLLSFRSLDGSFTESKDFIESIGNLNFQIKDMAFLGPGVNAVGGGGIKFERDTSSTRTLSPISNFQIENIRIKHSASFNALVVEGGLNGSITDIEINKCTFTGLALARGGDGGSNTMMTVNNIYSHQVTTPMYVRQGVYSNFDNVVFEGSSLGAVFDDCRACNVTYGWETLKYNEGLGYPLLLLGSNDMRIGPVAGYWNTQEQVGFAKAGITVAGEPGDKQNFSSAIIDAPYHHGSMGRLPIRVVEATGSTRLGRAYIDVTNFANFDDPGFTIESAPYYWGVGRLVTFDQVNVDFLFNGLNLFEVVGLRVFDFDATTPDQNTNDPDSNDDVNAGYSVLDTWLNTNTGEGFICVDNSAGAAEWITQEGVWTIEFETRLDRDVAATSVVDPAYAIRVGRNWGVDISNHFPLWFVKQSDTTNTGKVRFWLDPKDFFPPKFPYKFGIEDGLSSFSQLTLFNQNVITTTVNDPSTGTPTEVVRLKFNASAIKSNNFEATQTDPVQIDVTGTDTIERQDGGSFVSDGFSSGDDVNFSGFSNSANNDVFTIASVNASTITISSSSLVTETGSGDERVTGTNGYVWQNKLIDFNTKVTFNPWSVAYSIDLDYKLDDEDDETIYLYMKKFVFAGTTAGRNKVILRGCNIDGMNGEHTIEYVGLDTFTDGSGALQIRTSTTIESDYIKTWDYGVALLQDQEELHNNKPVQIRGGNYIELFDEFDYMAVTPDANIHVEFADGVAQKDITHGYARALNWTVMINGDTATAEVIDPSTVRVTRNNSSGSTTAQLTGTRKKRIPHGQLFSDDRTAFS